MTTSSLPRRTLFVAALALLGRTPHRATARTVEHGSGPVDCPTRDCGFVYDPAVGDPEHAIAPGLAFDDLPDDWVCPSCGRAKHLW